MSGRVTMSMEAAMDEERLGVLALLEGLNNPARAQRGSASSTGSGGGGERSSSPYNNPRSPVRSMLDIEEEPAVRHSSIAGVNGASVNSPGRTGPIRSMLDIGGNLPPQLARSAQASPTEASYKAKGTISNAVHPRSLSDAASRPAAFGPRAVADRSTKGDPTAGYQFSGYLTSNPGGPVAPKRNTLAGKKPAAAPSSMAEAVRGELSSYGLRDRGRHHSTSGNGGTSKSKSPHNRLGIRSSSPGINMLNTNSSNLLNSPGKFALDNGVVVDMNSAYRRLSDANLARAGGSLSMLSSKTHRRRTDGGDALPESGRLEKDYSYLAGEDAVAESSDDYEGHSSDEEGGRGRKKTTKDDRAYGTTPLGIGRADGPRQALSLMAAAEEERQQIAQEQQSKYKVRSLLEPEITVTGPGGDRLKGAKSGIHPTTAFDQGGMSGTNTPMDSDTEADISDIKRAQKLAVNMTPIVSTPETGRCVRTIFRGDFAKMQQEAQDDQRRVRKYLVATDLSDEAAHALEWTIGTVLRDGDTLLAIYCVDEEAGTGETTTAAQDEVILAQAATIAATTNKPQPAIVPGTTHVGPSPLRSSSVGPAGSAAASPMGREQSRAEQERNRAVDDITNRVSRLLRKTRLQVRVVIEVIHCKSPKHLITEVIDFINPTLVILGSRGRSALKGVILGSFSNYLVTKSSVPVMVARKRLRKHGKYKRPSVKLANNLTNISGKSLASAKID